MPRPSAFRSNFTSLSVFAVVSVALISCGAAALAKTTGVGDVPRRPVTFRVSAFQPLTHFGDDGVRVTYAAALGGQWSMELHPVDAHLATGDILFYHSEGRSVTPSRPKERIELGDRMLLNISRRDYDTLVSKIDAAMAQPDPLPDQSASPCPLATCTVCADGEDYLIERRKLGRTKWTDLTTCDDGERALDVPRLMVRAIPALQCWLFPEDEPEACYPPRSQDDDPPKPAP